MRLRSEPTSQVSPVGYVAQVETGGRVLVRIMYPRDERRRDERLLRVLASAHAGELSSGALRSNPMQRGASFPSLEEAEAFCEAAPRSERYVAALAPSASASSRAT
jgi:hypothetical protein